MKTQPMFGITRIDQDAKHNHGYYVRVSHRGKTLQKYFPDKKNGGKGKALKAAQAWRDEKISKMPEEVRLRAARKKRKIPQSGEPGVTHVILGTKTKYTYWQAAWTGPDGKRDTAKFNIERHGNDAALEKAIAARRAGVNGEPGPKSEAAKKKAPAKSKQAAPTPAPKNPDGLTAGSSRDKLRTLAKANGIATGKNKTDTVANLRKAGVID